MTLSQVGIFLLQFGASLIVARLLTPYEMGVFAMAVAIVGLLSTLRALGLSGYIVRARELNAAVLSSAFTINALIATLVSAIIVGLSTLGRALLDEPGVGHVLLVMAILPLIGIFEFLPASGIERGGSFRAIAFVNLVRALLANGVMLGLAFSGFSFMSLAYGQIAGSIAGTIVINIVGRRHVNLRLRLAGWQDIMLYGLQMLAISGINTIASRIADLMLGRLLGLGALGLYSRASGLNGLLWDNIHLVISRIVFVDFSERRRQEKSLRDRYLRIVRMVTALLWPAFAGLAIIAGPLVQTLYGENWIGAALPLSLLSMSAIAMVSITMTWEVFVVSEETALQARFEFVRAGVGLVLFAVGCLVSLVGAAAARIAEALVSVMLYRPHLERMTDTHRRDFIPIYMDSALLTALATTPAFIVMTFYSWSPQTPVPTLLVAVLVGIIGWLCGICMLRHPLFEEGYLILSRIWLRGTGPRRLSGRTGANHG
jgi:O-antigen/teichoic acid export membrane protein